MDGLAAEREQGITIDVAYRFFATERRKFIVADTPGHEQYTRNMVTGASTADLAVILVDARKGVLTQTRRHSYLVSLLGIRRIVLAVNKMDLVGLRPRSGVRAHRARAIASSRRRSALSEITAIPVSALRGDNIIERGEQHALVSRADADGSTWRRCRSQARLERAAVSHAGAMGQPSQPGISRLRRPDRRRQRATRGIACACCPRDFASRVARIVTADGDCRRRWPASRSR